MRLARCGWRFTATGIYGLLSFVTSERRREMGLRLALGARRGDILALVVGRGAALVVVGLAAGIPAGAAATRLLESFLFGIGQLDAGTFLAAPLVVAAAAASDIVIAGGSLHGVEMRRWSPRSTASELGIG